MKKKFIVDVSVYYSVLHQSVYYTSFKAGTYFQLKCSTLTALLSNVVFKFNCPRDTNCSYIDMTTRYLTTRAHEHLHSTTTKTAISEHLKVFEGRKKNSNINSLNIIRKYNIEYETKIHEALQIKKINPQLNKQLYANGYSFLLHEF